MKTKTLNHSLFLLYLIIFSQIPFIKDNELTCKDDPNEQCNEETFKPHFSPKPHKNILTEDLKSSCTTILVGKKASYDGSTMMARTEDSPAGQFNTKKHIVVKPENQPREYKSVLSSLVIPLPDNPLQYTCMPNGNPKDGIWGEAGINILNVAISETETISSNARVLGADPLVENGITEEDILTITLPYIKSAKEGVKRLGELLEKYGTSEMNGIGFQDENEVWWFETIGGHHWIAKRVPDDCYAVIPNQQGIDNFDFDDAFDKQINNMCSKDMKEFIKNNHLDLSIEKKSKNFFDVRAAFGSHTPFDRSYNTPRAWYVLKTLSPSLQKAKNENFIFDIESDDLPWSARPDKKVTIEDIKFLMSSYYQGTKYNPYLKYGDLSEKGKYRPIGVNRTNFCTITHIRNYMKDKLKAVEWIGVSSGAFNVFIPQYSRVNDTPDYLKKVSDDVSTDSFYWSSRLIAALSDPYYDHAIVWVERYQNLMEAKGHEFINKYDKLFLEGNKDEKFLEEANNYIADYFKEETTKCLGKVLYVASNGMKNRYARSDA